MVVFPWPCILFSFFLYFFPRILHFERALKTDNFKYISADLLEPGLFKVFTRSKVDLMPAIDKHYSCRDTTERTFPLELDSSSNKLRLHWLCDLIYIYAVNKQTFPYCTF